MFCKKYFLITLVALLALFFGCYGEADGVAGADTAQDFASQVIRYRPAPGQGLPSFAEPNAALGAPDGQVVTLGGFGGSLTLRLVRPILDRPGEADFVIWGNAFYIGGDPRARWAEPGLVEVSADGEIWYLIGGGVFSNSNPPASNVMVVSYSNTNTATWPEWADGETSLRLTNRTLGAWFTGRLRASDSAFTNSALDSVEDLFGFADCTPAGEPATGGWRADDPWAFGVSGAGGDAIYLEWAVDEAGNNMYASISNLAFRYVRITTAVYASFGLLGECSTEIDAVGVCP